MDFEMETVFCPKFGLHFCILCRWTSVV